MTSQTARLVVLAKSWKCGGLCVAGKRLDGAGAWLRLVADAQGGSLSASALRLAEGGEAEVLSVVEVPVAGAVPNGVQRENRLLGPGRWRYLGAWDPQRLDELADAPVDLWVDPALGPGRRFRPEHAVRCDRSLALVRVNGLTVRGRPHPYQPSGYRFTGAFTYGGIQYDGFTITSPRVCSRLEAALRERGVHQGTWSWGPVFLCVSASQPFHGYHYKLIAEVFEA